MLLPVVPRKVELHEKRLLPVLVHLHGLNGFPEQLSREMRVGSLK